MELDSLIKTALEEDIGGGDVTTLACINASQISTGRIVAKQVLCVAGQEVAKRVFESLGVTYEILLHDGVVVKHGDVIGRMKGPTQGILMAERLALNFLMRLSGIATNTRAHVQAAEGKFAVVDTRKSTPLHRRLEKDAVKAGGGLNHRFALYDGVLIKDNHITAAGSVTEAIKRTKAHAHHLLRIEVEVETIEQGEEAISAGAEVLLLDNMDDDLLKQAIGAFKGRAILEASGNMNIERLKGFIQKGIYPDLVSIGGLIHQATWVDLSLKFD